MRFAYADPPYFGCGASHYGEHHPEAAVWDDKQTHLDLIARLVDEYPDGWALSLNPAHLACWMACAVTRQRGLKGAKPEQFNQWVLDLLAYDPEQDTIDDLFPGTAGLARTLDAPPLNFEGGAA